MVVYYILCPNIFNVERREALKVNGRIKSQKNNSIISHEKPKKVRIVKFFIYEKALRVLSY